MLSSIVLIASTISGLVPKPPGTDSVNPITTPAEGSPWEGDLWKVQEDEANEDESTGPASEASDNDFGKGFAPSPQTSLLFPESPPSATFSATGVGEPDMDGEGQADGCVRVPSSGRLRCRAWNRAAKRSGSPSSTAWVRRPWLAIPEIDPCALAVSLLSLPGQLFVQFSEFLRKLEERMKMKFHLLVENVLLQTVAEVHGP
ncbi:hypothetical protein AK812_SmicGene42370 [Symbiodinium microadriaticum]|uniref:Uncharacterized protein n=1 Tax=Symbiodinium microadriaticum TaxID=2951 RepID=A0A1Q9C3R2_SYMMI|nr:hypothetical protein AK812_SmicGene42370 [Symbiodinium microadriaticum]